MHERISRRGWITAMVSGLLISGAGAVLRWSKTQSEEIHHLDPGKTFSSFYLGTQNPGALQACQAVAAGASGAHSLLYLWGPPGVGKTHLLQATARAVRRRGGAEAAWYGSANEFRGKLAQAIRNGQLDPFRRQLRAVRALILDDIQVLRELERTTEELVELMDWIQDGGAAVILSGDAAPAEITQCARLADRLIRGGASLRLGRAV